MKSTARPLIKRRILRTVCINECKQYNFVLFFPSHARRCFICYFWHSCVHYDKHFPFLRSVTTLMSACMTTGRCSIFWLLAQKGKWNHQCRCLIGVLLTVCKRMQAINFLLLFLHTPRGVLFVTFGIRTHMYFNMTSISASVIRVDANVGLQDNRKI